MIFKSILASLAPARLLAGLVSPLFAICAALGLTGFFLPGRALAPDGLVWFVVAPFVEELAWRAVMQNELASFFPDCGLVGKANVLTSLAFALAHIIAAPSLMAALTFFPSLCFGALWSRFRSLWLCGLLHLWYNTALRL